MALNWIVASPMRAMADLIGERRSGFPVPLSALGDAAAFVFRVYSLNAQKNTAITAKNARTSCHRILLLPLVALDSSASLT